MDTKVKSETVSNRATILFPAETAGWELWSIESDKDPRHLTDREFSTAKAAMIAIPAESISNFLIHTPSQQPDEVTQSAILQAERLSLVRSGETPVVGTELISSSPNNNRYRIDILDQQDSQGEWPDARYFSSSVNFLPLPENGAAFWIEQSRLIVAITRDHKILYYQALGPANHPSRMAANSKSLFHTLHSYNLLPPAQCTLCNWANLSTSTCQLLETLLRGTWVHGPRPKPRPPAADVPEIVPHTIQQLRRKCKAARKRRKIALAAAALYLVAIGGWLLYLLAGQMQVNRLQASLSPHAGEVERIQNVAQNWLHLQSAIEPETYPLLLLNHVYDTLPGDRAVQLNSFEIKDQQISLRGRASSVDLVFQLQRNLMKHPRLQHYHWNLDTPTILANNEAIFRIQGEH